MLVLNGLVVLLALLLRGSLASWLAGPALQSVRIACGCVLASSVPCPPTPPVCISCLTTTAPFIHLPRSCCPGCPEPRGDAPGGGVRARIPVGAGRLLPNPHCRLGAGAWACGQGGGAVLGMGEGDAVPLAAGSRLSAGACQTWGVQGRQRAFHPRTTPLAWPTSTPLLTRPVLLAFVCLPQKEGDSLAFSGLVSTPDGQKVYQTTRAGSLTGGSLFPATAAGTAGLLVPQG